MASLVIYGNEFDQKLNDGLYPEQFDYRILVEGDSWMDRSAMFETSLLQKLAIEMDAQNKSVLFINLAMFGDTIRRMGKMLKGEFSLWVNQQYSWQFDAILLSAGGNDFIDAARDPDPGQGILKDFRQIAQAASGHDCIDRDALAQLITQYMDPNFKALYNRVEVSPCAGIPIFLNLYDTPTARNAPAWPGGKAWLRPSYEKNGIDRALWSDLTDSIFNELQMTIAQWTNLGSNVHLVPTDGNLTPAAPDTTGSSGDWLNEIHPNEEGWKKLAVVWRQKILSVLP